MQHKLFLDQHLQQRCQHHQLPTLLVTRSPHLPVADGESVQETVATLTPTYTQSAHSALLTPRVVWNWTLHRMASATAIRGVAAKEEEEEQAKTGPDDSSSPPNLPSQSLAIPQVAASFPPTPHTALKCQDESIPLPSAVGVERVCLSFAPYTHTISSFCDPDFSWTHTM